MPPFAPRRARGSFIAATARAENPDWIDAKLNIEPIENAENSEPIETKEPIESREPAEPIDSTEPDEPMERIDPTEPMERMEPEKPIDRSEPPLLSWPGFFAMRALCNAGRSRRNVGGD